MEPLPPQDSAGASMPQQLGKYRIDGVIGRGGMGVVYRAHDLAIDRPVALKTIHRQLLDAKDRDEWLARFRREVKAAGRCMHPNIVTVFDYGEDGDTPFIVMELVEGRSLSDYLSRRPLSLKAARALMMQLLSGLQYAHEKGVIHRDIKPGNVLLLKGGVIKITDFGVARLANHMVTLAGHNAMGTPAYMAPEQLTGGEVTHGVDVYSAGVLFFELLCGTRPFSGESLNEVVYQVVQGEPPAISSLAPHLPPELDPLFARALAKDPADRFESCTAFAQAIRRALAQPTTEANDETERVAASIDPPAAPSTPRRTVRSTSKPAGRGGWDTATLLRLERQLSGYIGDATARTVVREAIKEAKGLDDLRYLLSTHIKDPTERLTFITQVPRPGQNSTPSPPPPPSEPSAEVRAPEASPRAPSSGAENAPGGLDQATLRPIEAALTFHLGPIAKVLVRKAAAQATSRDDLCRRLAEHIDNPDDRDQFLESQRLLQRD
ncbi:MAG: serine/threonine-protein kinase [Candidatus Competibacterales bacterium]